MKTNNFQNLVKFSCLGFSLISLQQLALASPVQASSLTGQFEIEGLLGEGNNSLSNNSFEILFTEE
nr:hypothetical protein [Crocosphaera sp.]